MNVCVRTARCALCVQIFVRMYLPGFLCRYVFFLVLFAFCCYKIVDAIALLFAAIVLFTSYLVSYCTAVQLYM